MTTRPSALCFSLRNHIFKYDKIHKLFFALKSGLFYLENRDFRNMSNLHFVKYPLNYYCGIRLRGPKKFCRFVLEKSNFATLVWLFFFLTTILTPRFVHLDGPTFRKWPNSCSFVLLDEYHSILYFY